MKPKRKKTRRKDPSRETGIAPAARLDDRGWDRAAPAVYLVLTVFLFAAFLFSGKMLFGTDTIPMGYAARKVFTDLFRSYGTIPLWNPYIMGGIPMVDGLMGGDMFYPTTLLQFVMPVHRAIGLKLVFHIFLAGWFFYLFAREKGATRAAGLVGGVSYMFAPYLISLIYAGHDGKLFVASLLPLGFLALERLLAHARFRDFLLFGFTIGLLILTAHLQLAFFACGAFGFRWIWHVVGAWRRGEREKVVRVTAYFVGAALLGAALGAVQTYPPYMYTSRFSPRAGGVTYEFATSWSIHWEEAVSMIVPEFGHYLDDYWGKNPFKLNCEAPGFIAMLLVAAGFFRVRKDKDLLFWYLVLLGTFIYAMGAETPFFRIIYAVVPKFFRAPSTILFLFSFGASFIAVRVLDPYWRGEDRKKILTGFAILGALLVLLFLMISAGEGFFRGWGAVFHDGLAGPKLQAAIGNVPKAQAGILVSLLIGALFVGVAEAGRRSRWPLEAVAAATVLLVFIGAWRTDRDFVRAVDLETYVREDGTIRKMAEDDGIFRVLSALPNMQGNYYSIFGFEAARGFFDNRTRWYGEISDPANINNRNILNLLNVKYLIAGPGMRHPSFALLASDQGRSLYRNEGHFPRAFVATRYETVDRSTMIGRLKAESFDPMETIFLEENPGFAPAPDGEGRGGSPVVWEEYSPNRLRMRVESPREGLLFVSNAWLPYWRARVDGEETTVLRADYAFQAVPIPSGESEVTLYFHSPPYARARAVSLAAVVFLIAGAAAVTILGWRGGGSRV